MNNKQVEEYDEVKEKEKKAYNALIGQLKLVEFIIFETIKVERFFYLLFM